MGRHDAVQPLSASRYKVQLTASSELKEKLERAARLLGHEHAGDLAEVIERALDLLIPSLEKARFGKTDRPRQPRKAKPGYVTRETRRKVNARDGEQCSFTSVDGERCPARTHLEVDHHHPRALGGADDETNIRILCRAHNAFAAERVFGKAIVGRMIRMRRKKQTSAAIRGRSRTTHREDVRLEDDHDRSGTK